MAVNPNAEWIAPDDWESILRPKNVIARSELGATPNEVAHGLAEADVVIDESAHPEAPANPRAKS